MIPTDLSCHRIIYYIIIARLEEDKSAFKILTSSPTNKRPSGSPRERWEDNIRMGLKEIGILI